MAINRKLYRIFLLACFTTMLISCRDKIECYEIDSSKMAQQVTITRDCFGVPHISGPTDESVFFGVAYAHAEDHFDMIENSIINAIGRQSEIKGESALRSDYIQRAFRINELSKSEYRNSDNKSRFICDAYAAGLNYFLETHPEVHPQLITKFVPGIF